MVTKGKSMTSMSSVQDFLNQKKIAVVGVSRNKRKFGRVIYKELKNKGYQVIPVNSHIDMIDDEPCYPGLKYLPGPVDSVVLVIPPAETEKVIHDAIAQNIRHIWMQYGSESKKAVRICEEKGINLVHGECILMFAEPVGFFHKLHRWLWKLLGKLPQ
jgi:predicted CoA-binding protein